MSKAPHVFVGMSGGVDSSVTALRLINKGYRVTGVFIKVWHPDFLVCNWEEERLDAMRVAAHLGIPFLTCDAETEYRDEVAKYFISEYQAGRTPNPDVMCNKHIKFGAFIRFAKEHKADYIATGHYVQKTFSKEGTPSLCRGLDKDKDQSYFLWSLSQSELDYSLFPVGDSIKETIRKEAKIANLPVALKKDSQGVCFLGHIDIKEFLSHYTEFEDGNVVNESGEVIGTHQGALIYTPGQRHGLKINTRDESRLPYYVVSKDIARNLVVASQVRPTIKANEHINLSNIVLREDIQVGEGLFAQTRYRQTPFAISVISRIGTNLILKVEASTEIPALGQSCVLYKDSCCIGGGIIC